MAVELQKTIQLPKTEFPMKANLPQREPEIQTFWAAEDLYSRLQAGRTAANAPKFVLHDGPPYANGDIHLGHALNKILKDIVVRSKVMQGHLASYVPGWDTHGLPIELQVIKQLGLDRHAAGAVAFRRRCRDYALKYVRLQRDQFKRLGVWGDWENPYLTLEPAYEAAQIEVFGEMATRGYIYKGNKPVYWCADCETALAEAEIEYHDHTSRSIYVKFAVVDDKGALPGATAASQDGSTSVLIWTTTPWTIPANQAVTVHPDYEYVLLFNPADASSERLLVAKELAPSVAKALGWEQYTTSSAVSGRTLEGIVLRHPLEDHTVPVILGDHVTLDAGTGCVHTAPGHGLEDYLVGLKYNLPVYAPVDSKGRFTAEAGKYSGMVVSDANQVIINDLATTGRLAQAGSIVHQYPHCWRCKSPILFRATAQWFASVEGFRDAALAAIHDVQWVPKWGEDRIHSMVADRSDWCISRQRWWGVPIPIFYCQSCREALVDAQTIKKVADLFRKEGSDAWFIRPASEILPDGTACKKCGGTEFDKETDIMDVWFDSGSSHAAVLRSRPDLEWPATMYLEGNDQYRGWFQSSLLTSIATTGKAPYQVVLTHGFTIDEEGRKMSKSLGNGVDPDDVIKRYGADILRLWVSSADYRSDVRLSENILQQLAEAYRRIRNTSRFMLGNLYDFDPVADAVPHEQLFPLDRWAVSKALRLAARVCEAYQNYEFHTLYHAVHNFCAVDMGGFYLDVLKDRLYCDAPDSLSRRSAQTAIGHILVTLVKLFAPVLVHTAEEVWQALPERLRDAKSVHLSLFPNADQAIVLDESAQAKWDHLLEVRRTVAKALEQARAAKEIGSSNEAVISLYPTEEVAGRLAPFVDQLAGLFIVSAVELHDAGTPAPAGAFADESGLAVVVRRSDAPKCERCWRFLPSIGCDPAHASLCERCASVVAEAYEAPDVRED